MDLASNTLFAVLNVGLIYALRKRPRPVVFLALLAAAGFASLMASALIGRGLFGMMRVLAWAVFVHGMIALAAGAVLLWKSHRPVAVVAAGLAGLTALVGLDAFFIEPHSLQIERFKIASAKVSRPLKIAIVADIQTDEVGPYERAALAAAMNEKPDLVLFAGHYLQEHDDTKRAELIRQLRSALKDAGLHGPKAAVAVAGNCDYADWPKIFEGTGVAHTTVRQSVRQADFELTALGLEDSFNTALSVPESNLFHIVVGHSPDYALGDVRADLLIAGHTHGGQVRLPLIGPLITLSRIPRAWAAVMTSLSGGRTLVVSRGIGMERGPAPRLRFLCRPQIVVVDVIPRKGQ